jgi:hypothetical protein
VAYINFPASNFLVLFDVSHPAHKPHLEIMYPVGHRTTSKKGMSRVIIALVGTKGVGKTTIAHHLVSMGFTEVSFADTLKDSLCVLLGMHRSVFDDPSSKEGRSVNIGGSSMSPREIMQQYGDAAKLLFGPNVFIDAIRRRLVDIDTSVVISDVRFRSEEVFVRSLGAQVYRVVFSPSIGVTHEDMTGRHTSIPPVGYTDRHESESLQYMITCDKIIHNDGLNLSMLFETLDTEFMDGNGVENRCMQCGTDLGDCNPRQLCGKTHCENDWDPV